jgi:type I restriction enzyme M protein
MSTPITQKEINQIIRKACDTFRGVIDPSQYKDYILTMLFVKYVSDVYKEKIKEYLEKYNGNEERAEYAMKHERFVVPKTSSFDYLLEHKNESNIGEIINTALVDFEEANRAKLSQEDGTSLFRNIDFNNSNL